MLYNARINNSITNNTYGYNDNHCWKCAFREICKPGYTWEQDEELILEMPFRVQCNEYTAELRRCTMEPGHLGEHDETWQPAVEVVEHMEPILIVED